MLTALVSLPQNNTSEERKGIQGSRYFEAKTECLGLMSVSRWLIPRGDFLSGVLELKPVSRQASSLLKT